MMRPLPIATLVTILVGAWLFVGVPSMVWPDKQEEPVAAPPGERTNLKTLVQGCKKCHEDICSEWELTQHAKSWTDPVFQAQIAEREDQGDSCARCHAPQDLLETGFGVIPKARKLDRELGVTCVTCHMKGNTYHGPFESTGHGGIDADPRYLESPICLSCHGQPEARAEHDQGTSFLATEASKSGQTCQTCHMPSVQRKLVAAAHIKDKYLIGVQPCRAHRFTGARRNEIVKGCATVDLKFETAHLAVGIHVATGHGLPASSDRDVVLTVKYLAADGKELGRFEKTWQFPGGPVIPSGKGEALELKFPEGTITAKAELVQILRKTPGRPEDIIQPITTAEATH